MKVKKGHDIETLYHLYYNDVYRYILHINYNKSNTEDIVQNTFLKAMSGLGNYRGEGMIRTWLFKIARNESIRYSSKNTPTASLDEISELSSKLSIEESYCTKETTLLILEYIKNLKEPKQSLMVLHLLYEIPFVQIGHIINKSDTWCRVTYMRIKNSMLKELNV